MRDGRYGMKITSVVWRFLSRYRSLDISRQDGNAIRLAVVPPLAWILTDRNVVV